MFNRAERCALFPDGVDACRPVLRLGRAPPSTWKKKRLDEWNNIYLELSKLKVEALRKQLKEILLSEEGKKLELFSRLTTALVREARQLEIQNGPDYKAVTNGKRIGRGWGVQC